MKKVDSIDGVIELRDEERQACEVWTRVMGYHRPVSFFNVGKQGEHKERVHFVESKTESCGNKADSVQCCYDRKSVANI